MPATFSRAKAQSDNARAKAERSGANEGPCPPQGERTRHGLLFRDGAQLRLVTILPVVLILLTVGYGLVSYLAFSLHWDELERVGAAKIAGGLWRVHLVALLVLVAIAAVAGVALSYTILRPVRALVEAAQAVLQGERPAPGTHLAAGAELEDLSQTFNAMLARLGDSVREREQLLMESLPLGVLSTDASGRITALSPIGSALLAAEGSALIGTPLAELACTAPQAPIALASFIAGFDGESGLNRTHEIPAPDEPEAAGYMATVTPLRDAEQRAQGLVFTFRRKSRSSDITTHFEQTDRLAALGAFSLGLAHELRNPLGAIKGLAQLLAHERGLPEGAGAYLERMSREVTRVDAFVRKLIDLSNHSTSTVIAADLAGVVEEAYKEAVAELPAERLAAVRVEKRLQAMPPVLIEIDRVVGALGKIIQNAFESTPQGGTVTLETRSAWDGAAPICQVVVSNTGSAIHPEIREKIFWPFFTTRESATGLGLTIANQVIAQNGGTLQLVDGEGRVSFVAAFDPRRGSGNLDEKNKHTTERHAA